ncbi:protein FAM246C-like [Equus caballus]|uniref:protein FAM246C-like n=1 Tax=Equus caballus TaxID=9796 RepID=UPI0038B24110
MGVPACNLQGRDLWFRDTEMLTFLISEIEHPWVQGHGRQPGWTGRNHAGARTPSCGHTWAPRPARPLLALPASCSGSPRAPGAHAALAEAAEGGEKVPPPRRRRPGPAAPQPAGRAQGRGAEPRDRPRRRGRARRAPRPRAPVSAAGRAARTHRPSLTIPGGGRGGRRGPSQSRVSAGRGVGGGRAAAAAAARRVREQRGGGGCRRRAARHPAARAGRPRRRGLYHRPPAPAPSCRPRPRPARPRLPAASFVCQPAAASPRRRSGTPRVPLQPRGGRPKGVPVVGLRPESAGRSGDPEVRRQRRSGCTWVAGIRGVWEGEGREGSRRVSGLQDKSSWSPSETDGGRLGTVPTGPSDGDNDASSRPESGRSPFEALRRAPQSRLLPASGTEERELVAVGRWQTREPRKLDS